MVSDEDKTEAFKAMVKVFQPMTNDITGVRKCVYSQERFVPAIGRLLLV